LDDILYTELAHYYAVIAADRDFTTQVDALARCAQAAGWAFTPGGIGLELFAGPAWHGQVLQDRFGMTCWCIDASQEMRTIATTRKMIDEHHYIVGLLPEALERIPSGITPGIVLAMRYSVGYLAPEELAVLLRQLERVMSPGGVIFLELHDLDILRRGFQELTIRTRTGVTPNGETVRCSWPDGEPVWAEDDWEITMTVRFEIGPLDSKPLILSTRSTEHIYAAKDIARLSAPCGLQFRDVTRAVRCVFPESRIIMLQKER